MAIRRVRTPEGARAYGQPVGSIIVEDVDVELPPSPDLAPPPPPKPGAIVYQHPQGGTIYVYADGSMEAYNKYGKKKPTSATPEKLAAGHGAWYQVNEESFAHSTGYEVEEVEEEEVADEGFVIMTASGLEVGHLVREGTVDQRVTSVSKAGETISVTFDDGHTTHAHYTHTFMVEDAPPKPPPPKKATLPKLLPGSTLYAGPGGMHAVLYPGLADEVALFNEAGEEIDPGALTPHWLEHGNAGWKKLGTLSDVEYEDAPGGTHVYRRADGSTAYKLPDGSLALFDPEGEPVFPDEHLDLESGGWQFSYVAVPNVESAETVESLLESLEHDGSEHGDDAKPPPKNALPAGAFQPGTRFVHPTQGPLTVVTATTDDNDYGLVHVTTKEGFEFWNEADELFEELVEEEEAKPKSIVTLGDPPPGALVYKHPQGATIYVLPDGSMHAFTADGKKKSTSATPAKLAAGHGGWFLVQQDASTQVVDDHDVGAAAGGEVEKPSTPPPAKFKHEKPMKFEPGDLKDLDKYVADPNIVFQQKLDGIRGQLVVSPGQRPWFRAASGGQLQSSTAAKTTDPLLKKLPTAGEGTGYAIDGEILNGKLYVFDMVVEGHEKMAYEDRLAMAEAWARHLQAAGVNEVEAVPTARTAEEKRRLHDAILKNGGEGVMAKRRDAGYTSDKRVTHSVKLKFTSTADAVVVAKNTGGHENYELAMMGPDGKLVAVGSTSALGKENAEVGDVVEVRYLYAGANGQLVQPTMIRRRPERLPEEATLDQLRHVNKEVVDASVMAEKGVRRVRTPEGVRIFGQPLGSVIVPDAPEADLGYPPAEPRRRALDARAFALEELAEAESLGAGNVDGKWTKDTIHSTAELHEDVEHEGDQKTRNRLSAAFFKGKRKRTWVFTDDLLATQGRLSRSAVRRTIEGFYPGDKTYRKGYRLQVVKEGGKLYVVDGHHRLEAAILLGEEELEADVVDTDKVNVGLALQLAKVDGPPVAQALRELAQANEADVSRDVQDATSMAGGRLELFDKRLKSEGAIVERISRNMASAAARGLEADAVKAGAGVPDVLRYTAVFEEDDYVNGSIQLMKSLNALGYKAHYGGWGNSWAPGGTYKGLNLRLVAPDSGQMFELQFHTPESLTAKRENHQTYVEWRNLAPDDPLKKALGKQMADRAKAVVTPQGAVSLNWRGGTWKDKLGWDGS